MKRKGFTLIELMIVVAIIGILLAMLLPRVGLLIDRSREKTTEKNLKNLYAAYFDFAEKGMGVFEWGTQASTVRSELTTPRTSETGALFDKIPYTLLRRSLTTIRDNDTIYNAASRTVTAVATPNVGGWAYITTGPTLGEFFINCSEEDSYGQRDYVDYQCQ